MSGWFSKARITAAPGFNRWRVPPASIAIHLCIGSVYAWSVFNGPLTRLQGVVAPAAGDWSLSQVVRIFTVAIVVLGLSAAIAGKWLEQVGPRLVGTVAALCWGGGFLLGGLGIWLHQLWLLYLGYGVIGGVGLGLGYVSPVSTLIRWFPDRRGMAAGMAIMGFGGGAMIGTPLKEQLIKTFYQAPVYLGAEHEVPLTTSESGVRLALYEGRQAQVVVVGESERNQMLVKGPAGVYVVGTGRTGAVQTFVVLGLAYLVVMLAAASSYRIPAPGWKPDGWDPAAQALTARRMISTNDVSIEQAMRTPQFALLWIVLCFNVTAGIGVLGVAKTMMTEIFGTALPDVVTSSYAATFVLMISLFNMLGRFFWASVSDWLGRKTTYSIFFVAGILLYLSIPYIAQQVSASPAQFWLTCFYVATMLIFTLYGGGFATIPAYISDLFGTRYVGGIHGRLLTAWSTAGVLGPEAITALREHSRRQAFDHLASLIEPSRFAAEFGAGVEKLPALIASKTVTLAKLLELAPPGTPNPTSNLYNTTMFLMAGLLALALVANLLIRPVDTRHHLPAPDLHV